MYNKKCVNTFLFVMALLCLITLMLPFINVSFLGAPSVFVKIIYYTLLVIFIVCLVAIVGIGIYSLFKNSFPLLAIQELLALISLIMLLVLTMIFLPILNLGLTVGFSILLLETFVMSCFNIIFKLIKKIPLIVKGLKEKIKAKKENIAKIKEEKNKLEQEYDIPQEKPVQTEPDYSEEKEEVEIIPPDDDMML